MANTVQIINDGPRETIVKITIAAVNIAAQVVTESTLSGAIAGQPRNLSVYKCVWSLTGGNATLSWDATADVVLAELSAGWGELMVPEGIPNNAGAGKTGNIQLDNAAGLTNGHIVLWIKKS